MEQGRDAGRGDKEARGGRGTSHAKGAWSAHRINRMMSALGVIMRESLSLERSQGIPKVLSSHADAALRSLDLPRDNKSELGHPGGCIRWRRVHLLDVGAMGDHAHDPAVGHGCKNTGQCPAHPIQRHRSACATSTSRICAANKKGHKKNRRKRRRMHYGVDAPRGSNDDRRRGLTAPPPRRSRRPPPSP